jgi:hypothetical protein
VSEKVFPLVEVIRLSDDNDRLPDKSDKKEEQGTLTKVVNLAPLFELVIRVLELTLKILRIIN